MGINTLEQQEIAFNYLTSDSVLLDVQYHYDSIGSWVGYTSHIKTPVCEDQLCYDVELEFYWDLIGNFSHFLVDSNKPLTKQDHIPFNDADYNRLNRILSTKSPSFIHLRRSELVISPENADPSNIDGNTGATAKEVKKDMVPGAVYTCYTLWHIANGGIEFRIQEHTKQKLDEDVIRQLLNTDQIGAHYFLIENVGSEYFELFINDFMELAQEYDPYFTGRIIDRIPMHLLQNFTVQEFFLRQFHSLEFSSKNTLIAKLEGNTNLSESALKFLMEHIRQTNPEQNDQIIRIVYDNADSDKIEMIKEMIEMIDERQIVLSPASYELLISLGDQFASLKSTIREFKKNHQKHQR